jgi:cytosine/adenosine deaminase-related metal-dependent hydrolase
MVIISAPWVVPVGEPIIQDGSVVVTKGRIVDIGSRDAIVQQYPHAAEKSYPCVLMPGLVNAHMHLELSYLAHCIEPGEKRNFTDWIDALIAARNIKKVCRDEIVAAFLSALKEQYISGVALIGDIGNEYYDELHCDEDTRQPKIARMLEFLGPNREACQIALTNMEELEEQISATAHAPYSTPPYLLRGIKKRCNRLAHIFSIHTGECSDERAFIRTGAGVFREFLDKKSSWDGVFPFSESGFSGAIEYFDQLGILDDKTLLVHCVHVSGGELQLIKERGARICLCPGSNEFLGVGLAPVEKMVALGLQPALGTDSPASNRTLDIWREMQLVQKSHDGLDAGDILAMATLGGAKALAEDGDYGTLKVGKKAHFIHVSSIALSSCCDREEIIKILVSHGKPENIEWVSTSHE